MEFGKMAINNSNNNSSNAFVTNCSIGLNSEGGNAVIAVVDVLVVSV